MPETRKFSFWIILLLALVVFYGGFLRLWKLGEPSLWIDEGFTINGGISIQEKGLPVLDSGRFYTNGLFSTYLTALTEYLFDSDPFSPWSARLPSAFFGTFLIIVIFLLYRQMFDDDFGATIVSIIIAFSYWEVAWSRQARGYTIMAFFIVIALMLAWRYLKGKKYSLLLFSYGSLGFACVAQASALAFVPGFLALSFFNTRKKESRNGGLSGLQYLGTTILIIFFLFLLACIIYRTFPIRLPAYVLYMPADLLLLLLGSLCAWIFSIHRRVKQREVSFLAMFIFIPFFLVAFFSSAVQHRYMFSMYTIAVLPTIWLLLTLINTYLTDVDRKLKILITCTLVFLIFIPHLNIIPRVNFSLEEGSPQPDFKSVFNIIRRESREGDVVVSGYPQLHKVYLGEKGVWLKMNLNGKPTNVENKIIHGKDYYVGAPIIYTMDELADFIKNNHGFIIVDTMTDNTWPKLFIMLENNPSVSRLHKGLGEKKESDIYLYRF